MTTAKPHEHHPIANKTNHKTPQTPPNFKQDHKQQPRNDHNHRQDHSKQQQTPTQNACNRQNNDK
jgi:hypothetical protein